MATTSCGRSRRHALLLATTVLMSGLAAPAVAQVAQPPVRETIDDNGVDVLRGSFVISNSEISIGQGSGGLEYRTRAQNGIWSDADTSTVEKSGSAITVTIKGVSDGFTDYFGTYTATEGNGATLVQSGANLIYTAKDGTVATFYYDTAQYFAGSTTYIGRLKKIARPDGYTEDYFYGGEQYCGSGLENGSCPSGMKNAWRLLTVTNSNGYQLSFGYDSVSGDLYAGNIATWSRVAGVAAINLARPSESYAYTSISTSVFAGAITRTATDPLGRTTTYYKAPWGSGGQMTVKRPGASSPNITVNYSSGVLSSVMREGVTYNYSFAYNSGTDEATTTVTAPDSSTRVYVSNGTTKLLSSYKDELNRLTSYTYDSSGRVTEVTMPEGNKFKYTYDARGNITERRAVAKTSGPADIVMTASFPSSCSNIVTCNKPTSMTDALGNQTDYTYDSTHGGVLTVTAPAPVTSGTRPQTRYGYATRNAYYSTSFSTPVAGPNMIVLASVSTCRTTASCSGAADEVKTTIDYGPQVTGTGNNLSPISTTKGAGDGSLTATTAYTYDYFGNQTYVDGPLSGTADTTRTLYDAARQIVGVISPDPDGGGSLPNRAQRFTYNSDGQVTVVERGTTAGQTDSAWSGFTTAEKVTSTYDANARKTKTVLANGSTNYGVTQYSYDAIGRPECSAVRMNSAVWGSLPSSACTAGTTGSFGADRIGKTTYNAASQVTKLQSAYGQTEQGDEVTMTYTSNGLLTRSTDANGNLSIFEYDGFDRQRTTFFPSSTTPGTTTTGDYELYSYDANGNVTQRRLRDGQTIAYSYDNLNRLTLKDVPNTVIHEYDITYQYDLLGRMTQALDSNTHVTNMGYDALGRLTSEGSNWTTRNFQYDLAGRRTRTTWGDGFYVTYDRLVTGEVSAIRENGATSGVGVLVTYSYDTLGRRMSLTRGNGTVTSYVYDAVSRLTNLLQDLAGSGGDLSINAITYNPAGQIVSSTRNNDSYAWTGHSNRDLTETPNGLNQLVSQGSTSFGYDGRGNVTSAGAASYGYTSENRLAVGPGGYVMTYDPLGRYHWIYSSSVGGTFQWMQYDGSNVIEERGNSGVLRRYVHNPDTADEPLVWYEGSGTSDRRWLHADERGSVIAVTIDGGWAMPLNTYDEYGTPSSTNVGRFGYTGQTWLPELGLWYYKARIYDPATGRFMQTDPIGYSAGMNLYAYVGGDPVNKVDPSGLLGYDAVKRAEPIDTITVTGTPGGSSSDRPALSGISLGSGIAGGISDGGDGGYDSTITVSARQAKPGSPPRAGSLLRQAYRWFNPDVCKGKGTNEGAGKPAGVKPYDVNEGASLAALFGHVLPDHDFGDSFSDSRYLTGAILTTIMTNPVKASGGSIRYTVNVGQNVGWDRKNEAYSDYLTVIMTPPAADGSRALQTAYPGCP